MSRAGVGTASGGVTTDGRKGGAAAALETTTVAAQTVIAAVNVNGRGDQSETADSGTIGQAVMTVSASGDAAGALVPSGDTPAQNATSGRCLHQSGAVRAPALRCGMLWARMGKRGRCILQAPVWRLP